jgi:hypothetical protein
VETTSAWLVILSDRLLRKVQGWLTVPRVGHAATRSLHYFSVAEEIGFHVAFSGTVDFNNAIICDVDVITGDV